MKNTNNHKRPREIFSMKFLLGLFFISIIIGAVTGAFRDGPQLDETSTQNAVPALIVPDISQKVNDSLRRISAGAATENIVTYKADKLLYIAPPEAKEYIVDKKIVTMFAQMIWGEGRGIYSITEQAAIAWCPLNRVDSDLSYMPDAIELVLTPDQFHGYRPWYPTVDDFGRDLEALAEDVLIRWMKEKDGQADVGRVLPTEYLYFSGKDGHNVFRTEYRGGTRWDWSLPSPYES